MNHQQKQYQEQKRWILNKDFQHVKLFDQLLFNEFRDQTEHTEIYTQRLLQFIDYATRTVPYYRDRKSQYTLNKHSFSIVDLATLPCLSRQDVQTHYQYLVTQALPPRFRIAGAKTSSGTTGEPVKVLHTVNSLGAFAFYKQREYRCWGLNPSKSFISIRPPSDLPLSNGERLKKGESLKLACWRYVGRYFKTGAELYLPDTTAIANIVAFIEDHKPDYLLTMAATLEHIALAYSSYDGRSSLAGALSISQQLTDSMRQLAEKYVSPRIYQNYGLNEVGIVAMRCAHSNHFHVHNENVVIEVVNSKGQPCQPGEAGRLLVTNISNPAMPLLRYDTDDSATVPTEPCPCGRTSQSFTNIRGRYRRIAHLPAGTWEFWDNIVNVFADADTEDMRPIQQYQLHQLDEAHYRLKLKTTGPVAGHLKKQIYRAWEKANGDKPVDIHILELDTIENPGKKFQNFISDIAPLE